MMDLKKYNLFESDQIAVGPDAPHVCVTLEDGGDFDIAPRSASTEEGVETVFRGEIVGIPESDPGRFTDFSAAHVKSIGTG